MVLPSLKCGVGTPNKLNLWKLDELYFRFFASPVRGERDGGKLFTQITLSGKSTLCSC
jgi:hypothetical protein